MARLIAVIILFAVALSCASADEEPSFAFFDHDYKRTPLGDVIDKASMKLLKATYTEAIDKNVIASPLGVLILLSLYSTGAEGPIRDEIVAALGAEDYDQLLSSYTRLSSQFSAMDSSYLTLANKVYVAEQYQLAEDFTATAERSFHSVVERIDFTQPKEAAAVINRWADEKTKGHIKNAVTEDALDPDIAAGLFNVIFFQGHWNVPFNASETLEKDFHVNKSTTVQKPMMRLKRSLFYHEDKELGARMVELPYKEHNFRMVVVLPDEVDGLPALLENVAAKGLLSDVFALRPSGCDVILEMPKFEINSDLDLNKLLPKVGVSKIFSEPATGVLKAESVKVSKAFQKAFVKVDEEGATAGAFTGFLIVTKSGKSVPPPPLEFKVDRPFLFTILHEDITLFTGMVIVPMSLDSTPPPPMEFKADHPFLFVILHDDIVLFSGTYTH